MPRCTVCDRSVRKRGETLCRACAAPPKNPHAVALASIVTEKRRAAARKYGKLGGRPKGMPS